jgi:hypothetical protein
VGDLLQRSGLLNVSDEKGNDGTAARDGDGEPDDASQRPAGAGLFDSIGDSFDRLSLFCSTSIFPSIPSLIIVFLFTHLVTARLLVTNDS